MPFRAFLPPKSPGQTSPNAKKTAARLHPSRRRAALCKMRSVPLRKPPRPGYADVPAAAPPRASPRKAAHPKRKAGRIFLRRPLTDRGAAHRAITSARTARASPRKAARLSESAQTQKPPRKPCFSGLRGGFSHIYAFASVSMAWAKILTLSMNFSQSIYSSGIWQVSTSPGKLMPKATVLGIMRE